MKKTPHLCLFIIIVTAMANLPQSAHGEAVYIIPPITSESGNILKYQTVAFHGQTYSKPTCPASSPKAHIYVFPVHMLGYGNGGYIYGIAGVSTYALDYGSYWQIGAEMRTLDGGFYADGYRVRVFAQIWCCKNMDCYDY
ncbi:MAG: hypothetical protein ABFD12_00280 [Syntrophorhabdus sp.]